MAKSIKPEVHVFETMDAFAAFAVKYKHHLVAPDSVSRFSGNVTFDTAVKMARRTGWTEQIPAAMDIAESAVRMAEKEHMIDVFKPSWDVSGAEVDMGRWVSGEPECMIDFPLAKVSKAGKVVTLVASMSISGGVETDVIERRGRMIVALALALAELGHATELWADFTAEVAHGADRGRMASLRVKVKGVNDALDPGMIMFAYAHGAMLRKLAFAALEGTECNTAGNSIPADIMEADYPEGAVFIPGLLASEEPPSIEEFLEGHLRLLGLLAE